MNTIDILNKNGYVKDLFIFDRSSLELMETISNSLTKLSKKERKNLFGVYPPLKEIISQSLKKINIDCELTNYCFYIEKNWQQNWSLALHQDVNFPDYLKGDNVDFDRWRKDGFWLRINLDASDRDTGALKVISGSHHSTFINREQTPIFFENKSGEVILFKPLLLHGSNKMKQQGKRRIIQAFCIQKGKGQSSKGKGF